MKNGDSEHLLQYAGLPHLELVGNRECYVDGLQGIEEYTSEKIRFNLGKLSVSFFGDGLFIQSFSCEGALVEGTIITVEFLSHA